MYLMCVQELASLVHVPHVCAGVGLTGTCTSCVCSVCVCVWCVHVLCDVQTPHLQDTLKLTSQISDGGKLACVYAVVMSVVMECMCVCGLQSSRNCT